MAVDILAPGTPFSAELDEWLAAHEALDRLHARDILAPLTWGQWCIWQAWAVCGAAERSLPGDTLLIARRRLLASVKRHDLDEPKRDPAVPVLRERDLLTVLDDEAISLWLNRYVTGRSVDDLAAAREISVSAAHKRLVGIRAALQLLLPPDVIGGEHANAQCSLTF